MTRATSLRRRRLAGLGFGAAVVTVYLVAAFLSAGLSPLARHPVLDGTGTPQPYRWVTPPPDQAASNQKPSPVSQTLKFSNGGASGYVFTPDGQAALIIGRRSFDEPGAEGQTGVLVSIQPIDPATLGSLPPGRQANGNAYRVRVTFDPSGAELTAFSAPVTLTLIYPPVASTGLRPPDRTILWSKDGERWSPVSTIDSHAGLQAAATVRNPGYFVVATPPVPTAAQTASRLRIVAIAILIGLAVFVLAGILYVVRARRRDET